MPISYVSVTGVLALVPGVEDSQYEPLLQRLISKSEAAHCGDIRIGLARFPGEAICEEDLIDLADRRRLVRGVSTSPNAGQIQARGNVSL